MSVDCTLPSTYCIPVATEEPCAIFVQDFYGLTLDALKEAKNDRLWFKTQLKLCGLWFKLKEYGRGAKILRELHRYSHWQCPSRNLLLGRPCLLNADRLPAEQLMQARTPTHSLIQDEISNLL